MTIENLVAQHLPPTMPEQSPTPTEAGQQVVYNAVANAHSTLVSVTAPAAAPPAASPRVQIDNRPAPRPSVSKNEIEARLRNNRTSGASVPGAISAAPAPPPANRGGRGSTISRGGKAGVAPDTSSHQINPMREGANTSGSFSSRVNSMRKAPVPPLPGGPVPGTKGASVSSLSAIQGAAGRILDATNRGASFSGGQSTATQRGAPHTQAAIPGVDMERHLSGGTHGEFSTSSDDETGSIATGFSNPAAISRTSPQSLREPGGNPMRGTGRANGPSRTRLAGKPILSPDAPMAGAPKTDASAHDIHAPAFGLGAIRESAYQPFTPPPAQSGAGLLRGDTPDINGVHASRGGTVTSMDAPNAFASPSGILPIFHRLTEDSGTVNSPDTNASLRIIHDAPAATGLISVPATSNLVAEDGQDLSTQPPTQRPTHSWIGLPHSSIEASAPAFDRATVTQEASQIQTQTPAANARPVATSGPVGRRLDRASVTSSLRDLLSGISRNNLISPGGRSARQSIQTPDTNTSLGYAFNVSEAISAPATVPAVIETSDSTQPVSSSTRAAEAISVPAHISISNASKPDTNAPISSTVNTSGFSLPSHPAAITADETRISRMPPKKSAAYASSIMDSGPYGEPYGSKALQSTGCNSDDQSAAPIIASQNTSSIRSLPVVATTAANAVAGIANAISGLFRGHGATAQNPGASTVGSPGIEIRGTSTFNAEGPAPSDVGFEELPDYVAADAPSTVEHNPGYRRTTTRQKSYSGRSFESI